MNRDRTLRDLIEAPFSEPITRPGARVERLEPRTLLNGAINSVVAAVSRRHIAAAPVVQPLIPSASAALSTTTWSSLGPTQITNGGLPGNGPVSGRITGIAADPSDPNTIYVASAGGGVWKTTTGGSSWTPLTDNQPVLAMGAIAVAPSNPSIIYAATGEAENSPFAFYGDGVLKSADGGATWTLLAGNNFFRDTISRIIVDPANPANIYCSVFGGGTNTGAPAAGVYHSTDGGATWSLTTTSISGFALFTDLKMDPTNPQHLFCGVRGNVGTGGVYVTTNGGASWSLINSLPNGSLISNVQLAISPSNSNVVYASFANGRNQTLLGLYASTDGGVTWVQLTNTPNYLGINGANASVLAVDPHNANTVYAGGQSSLIESTDGGQTWTEITTGSNGNGTYGDHHSFAFDAAGQLLDGNDGGIWRLDNSAAGSIAWSDLNTNLQIGEFVRVAPSPSDPNTLFAGSVDTGIAQYSGNPAWTDRLAGSAGVVQIDPQNPSRIYAQVPGSVNFFVRSDDGGATWVGKTAGMDPLDPQFSPAPFAVDPFNGNHLVYGTNHVYESFNGGDSWIAISTPGANGWVTTGTVIRNLAIAPSDPNTIYATFGQSVYVTHNDGGTWAQENTPYYVTNFSDLTIDPTNANVAYVTLADTYAPLVWRTTDGGATWEDMTDNLPVVPVNSIAVNSAQSAIYVGTDNGVYVTTDDGTNWAPLGTGLPNVRVYNLEYNPSLKTLVAATFGRGVWEISTAAPAPLVVNTLADETVPGDGQLSLREAVATAESSGQAVTFDPSLAGGTINLDPANGPLMLSGPLSINGITSGRITVNAVTGADLEVTSGTVRLSDFSLTGSDTVLTTDLHAEAVLQDDSISAPVADGGTLVAVQFSNSTYSGPITGYGSLVKSGPATLTLTASSSHRGAILQGGTLIGNTSSLTSSIQSSWDTTLVFDQSTLASPTDNTFLGKVLGDANIHILGPSSVVRIGTGFTNPVFGTTGTTTIDAGAELVAAATDQLGPSSGLVLNGTLNLGGYSQTVGYLEGTGTVYDLSPGAAVATLAIDNGATNHTFSGVLENVPPGSTNTGILALALQGQVIVTLAPANGLSNTYTGGTGVGNGTLIGNTRGLEGYIGSAYPGAAVTFDQSLGGVGDGTFVGTIDSCALTIERGTVRLDASSHLRGNAATEIDGKLVAETAGQFSSGSPYTVNGVLDLGGFDQAIGSLSGTGTVYNSGSGNATLSTGALNNSTNFYGLLEDRSSAASGTGQLALNKLGSGALAFVHPNTYSGGTTVSGGTLLAPPSAGDVFGSGPINLKGGTLSLDGRTTQSVQHIVPVTGFNQDVIVEASATDPAAATTTSFDGSLNKAGNNVLYEQGFGGPAAAGTGLPSSDASFTSLANPAVTFQLAPYNANNVALMNAPGQSVTLQLQTPANYQSLNLLATGAYNGGNINVTLNFADGTATTYSTYVSDWFNGANAAYLVSGRVKRDSTAALEIANNNPRLYEYDYALQPADQGKVLNSITFTESSGNVVGIFAISGSTLSMLPTQSYPNDVQVSADSGIMVADSPMATFGNLTLGANQLHVSGNSGTTLTFGSVNLNGNATLNPDAGTSISLGAISGGQNSLTQNGPGTLQLTGSDSYAATVVNAGKLLAYAASSLPTGSSLTIGATGSVELVPAVIPVTAVLGSLSVTPGGTFDLTDNNLQLSFPPTSDPVASMRSLLADGSVFSSLSDANHAIGYATGADDTVPGLPSNAAFVKLTVPGDTNLDGTVNLTDFLNLTRHFGQTNASWSAGDFNYDGTTTLADLLTLTRHFGQHFTTPAFAVTAAVPGTSTTAHKISAPAARRRAAGRIA